MHAEVVERVSHGEPVHDSREHAHLIADYTVESGLLKLRTAVDVAAADNERDLHAKLDASGDFTRNTAQNIRIDALPVCAQRLSAKFKKNSVVNRLLFLHDLTHSSSPALKSICHRLMTDNKFLQFYRIAG